MLIFQIKMNHIKILHFTQKVLLGSVKYLTIKNYFMRVKNDQLS
jgi:hypothetical protein